MTNMAADNALKNPASSPIEKPIKATKSPTDTNERTTPEPNAKGPSLLRDAAVPSTIGKSGRTQGERMESEPAANARMS